MQMRSLIDQSISEIEGNIIQGLPHFDHVAHNFYENTMYVCEDLSSYSRAELRKEQNF